MQNKIKYISALSSDAAFAPYSTPSDLSRLTSSCCLARAFLIDDQHTLSLPLSLASLQCEHVSELPNTHKSCLKAIFITCSCFLRKCIINQCLRARVLSSPGLLLVLEAQIEGLALGEAKGKARKENWYRFCWWSGKKLKQVAGVLSDQWCPCSFPTLCLRETLYLKPARGRAAVVLRKQLC